MAEFMGYQFNDFPKIFHFEGTATCTSKCVFCPVPKFRLLGRDMTVMPFDLCRKIIDQFPSGAVERVSPFIQSEPLIYKDLVPLMKLIKENSPTTKISIYTNASLLTKEKALEILDAGLDYVHFSMGGISKLTYEKHYVGLVFEYVMSNIIRFVKLAQPYKKHLKMAVALAMTGENKHELERFKQFWHEHGIHDVEGSWVTNRDRDNYVNGLFTTERKPSEVNAPCLSTLFDHFWIYGNGNVGFCCEDSMVTEVVGNVYTESIKDIWLGEKLNRLRKLHLERRRSDIPVCSGCNHQY